MLEQLSVVAGALIDHDLKVLQLLETFPPEFDTIVTILMNQPGTSFEQACRSLEDHERRVLKRSSSSEKALHVGPKRKPSTTTTNDNDLALSIDAKRFSGPTRYKKFNPTSCTKPTRYCEYCEGTNHIIKFS